MGFYARVFQEAWLADFAWFLRREFGTVETISYSTNGVTLRSENDELPLRAGPGREPSFR